MCFEVFCRGGKAELTDVDCHEALVHSFHRYCPASESHYSKGGWNGYNMKYSQVPAGPS